MNNLASEGAGLYMLDDSDADVRDCTFMNNTVTGGGFPVGGAVSCYFASPTIDNCLLLGNTTELGGGGMYLEGASPVVTNCKFIGNSAFNETEGFGGGLLNSFDVNATIVNCLFAGNSARRGGGVASMVFTTTSVINCTIVDNTATGGGLPVTFGGGYYSFDSNSTMLRNCVVWNNGPDQISGTPSVEYSNVQGGFAGAGNVNVNPMFVDADGADNDPATAVDNDYRLKATSPCVDAGDSTVVPADVTVDLDGEARFVDIASAPDTGVPEVPGGPVVDMGAFEVQPLPLCPADVNGDGSVNIADLLGVIASWGATGNNPADVNGDGTVNITDLLGVIAAWGACG
jgi:hypothetical protein